jgi:hypothetical protein
MAGPVVDAYAQSCTPRLQGGEVLPGFDPNRVMDIHSIAAGNLILKLKYNLAFLADAMPDLLRWLWYLIVLSAGVWVAVVWWAGVHQTGVKNRTRGKDAGL